VIAGPVPKPGAFKTTQQRHDRVVFGTCPDRKTGIHFSGTCATQSMANAFEEWKK
jgi:hypothetical protein